MTNSAIAWKMIILLFLAEAKNSVGILEGNWHQTFKASVIRSGHFLAVPAATASVCGNLCVSFRRCQSFGHNSDNKTCWLYDHMVEFATKGASAPGTRYFWRLSQTCPAELSYTLENGTCYKIDFQNKTYSEARDFCGREGGSLLIVNKARLQLLVNKLTYFTWAGGSDMDVEGIWWLSDGTRLNTSSHLWAPSQPDNWAGAQHGLSVSVTGKLDDAHLQANFHVACQIHLL